VLGIIIIPWVLQGPAPESSVTQNVPLPAASTSSAPREYRMDLSGQAAQPPAAPAAVLPNQTAQSANPVATSGTQNPSHQAPASVPVNQKPQPIARAAADNATATGGWMVQAGSYGSEHNALKLQKTLEQHGYRVQISRHNAAGKTYYRVWVGPYAERAAAEKAIPAIDHIYGGKAKAVPNS
jgi:DedD protein